MGRTRLGRLGGERARWEGALVRFSFAQLGISLGYYIIVCGYNLGAD